MEPNPIEALFNPKSIAVFGASASGNSVGARVFANLLAGGFSGPIVPINPKYKEVSTKPCYASVAEAGIPIDLALIATPASTVDGIIEQCSRAGIRNAIVLSAGFGETGTAGAALQAQVLQTARRCGVRFLGPNCVGLVRPWLGLDATFLNSTAPPGRLALVSQSGALCSAIADWATPHHLGISALISVGNSADIDFDEVLNFLTYDPKTEAILLYVEGVRHARSFLSALRVAARQKPVVVIKAGRHKQSAQAAHTHTGALIGSDAVFDAALERAGAVRAHTFEQLFAAAEILAANVHANGARLAIITNGGGAGVLAADQAADLNLTLPTPSAQTATALNDLLPPYWSKTNPVDILGDASAHIYEQTVRVCLQDPNYDGVLVMLTPQAMTDASEAARAVVSAVRADSSKPVLACWMGETSVSTARNLLSEAGIPDFTTPERAVQAFAFLARHQRNRELALQTPAPMAESRPPDVLTARQIIQAALLAGRDGLSATDAKAVLKAFDIPVNESIEVHTAQQACAAAAQLGFPVAIKINSPQITHKSDVGGVHLNLTSTSEVAEAVDQMMRKAAAARPDATLLGVTVESMLPTLNTRELVIGASRDPVFGPTILFGAGGTMVEILKDTAIALPPLNRIHAERLINKTRVARLLGKFRDMPAVRHDAVVDVLLRISKLVCELPEVLELDINPLLASPNGVICVDARFHLARVEPGVPAYDHLAIMPYPHHLETHQVLPDGTRVTIRPIRAEDAQSEQAFVRALSVQAKNSRFFHALKELSPSMLAEFTQIDYSREMALVGLIDEDHNPVQAAVARYVTNPDNTSCEFAVVVADQRQKQGIGTRLMTVLIEAAKAQGLKVMEGTVLAANRPMLALTDKLRFTRHPHPDDHSLSIVRRQL